MTSVLHQHTAGAPASSRSAVERYLAVRQATEALALPLSAEDQVIQSMPDVSPTKWHRAHMSWFFETFLLRPGLPGYEEFHPAYAFLFNSYYEAVGPRHPRPQRGLISRPDCADVTAYRRHVDDHMMTLLEKGEDEGPGFLFELGLHHEQQHQELLLMDIKHVLSNSPLDPEYVAAGGRGPTKTRVPGDEWFEHPGGKASVGFDGEGFAFDNEMPAHAVQLRPFAISGRLVTCGQWLEFMTDGGYARPELWLSDGWTAIQEGHWDSPLYWRQQTEAPDDWTVFTLNGRKAIDVDEPVCHVSYYEADAYATWAGARPPTQFEWEAVAARHPVQGRFLDPCRPHPEAQAGTTMYGDAWAWTASAYLPYPGFKAPAGAVGEYNGKFMVNQHVLRGGSCVTPDGHVRATYRNFFPPASRWPFTGLRLARDL